MNMEAGQLRDIIARHRTLRDSVWGVYAKDNLPRPLRSGGYILNSANASDGGEHWLALWVTSHGLEFFDSFAKPPAYYGLRFTTVPTMLNVNQLQSDNSTTCGGFVLYFLFHRSLGGTMESILSHFNANTRVNDRRVIQFVSKL